MTITRSQQGGSSFVRDVQHLAKLAPILPSVSVVFQGIIIIRMLVVQAVLQDIMRITPPIHVYLALVPARPVLVSPFAYLVAKDFGTVVLARIPVPMVNSEIL